MSDGFTEMVIAANQFFTKLAADNTKAFYEEHKAFYTSEIKKPAELMADLFAEDLARHTGKPHGPKIFRIHRDVRFSKDKTPYNTHLHLLWSRPTQSTSPAWFFGAAPDYMTLGMGVMGLDKDSLIRFRHMVDAKGDTLTDAMASASDAIGATLSDWGPAPLKRVPKPYDQNHPHAELLKRKAFAVSASLPSGWQDAALLKTLNTMVLALLPVWAILDETFPG